MTEIKLFNFRICALTQLKGNNFEYILCYVKLFCYKLQSYCIVRYVTRSLSFLHTIFS
jgi:hypothetical protein